MTENVVLMRQARESLSGKWGLAIGTFVLYLLITGGIQVIREPYIEFVIAIVIGGPFALGISRFVLSIIRNTNPQLPDLFEGFKKFELAFFTYLLMTLIVLVWMLLLVVPGIIAAIGYSQAFFIIADDPSMKPMEALNKSKKMMDGYKAKYFRLSLRLCGLGLLCILTLGIGFFWLLPYAYVCYAKFYEDLTGGQVLHENTDGSLLHGII